MEHKTWLWRKKSSEKTIVATDRVDISLKRIDEEDQMPTTEGRARIVKNLNEKLASVILDCHAKDDELSTKNVKMAPEANAGCDTAEADSALLKKELDEALLQGRMANEKLNQSDAALQECMQQLNFVRHEQEQRIRDAIIKTTSEFEQEQIALQDKLIESNRKLEELVMENSHLHKAILVKEKLIEDQLKHKSEREAEFDALMSRLDITEKENAFLKYEFHVLEKELEIRNEEMEYNRRSADLAHKQHLDGIKKIAKLEAECQKLRLLLQKRLPGPAAVVKMKNEVEMLRSDRTNTRRRKSNPTKDLIVRESTSEHPVENPSKCINVLLEQIHNVEEENKTLKEIITKKNSQLHSSRSMQLKNSSPVSSELSTTGFDISNIDGISSYSWAEYAHSRDRKLKNPMEHKAITIPEMRLMDDFVEMEKLALVSELDRYKTEEIHSAERSFDWLQVVLQAISEHKRISNRNLEEIVEDIKIALGCSNLLDACDVSKRACSMSSIESDPHVSGYIAWKSPSTSPTVGSIEASSVETNLSKSICKIVELVEGIDLTSSNAFGISMGRDESPKPLAAQSDYFVRVFQWKSSELSTVLQQFLRSCNDLLNNRTGLENFASEVSFTLEWIMNNCVTPKEASSARDKIKRHFGWSEPQTENEVSSARHGLVMEEQPLNLDSVYFHDQNHNDISQKNGVHFGLEEENKRQKDDLKNMEVRLESDTAKVEALNAQLHESEESIRNLQAELKVLRESKEMIEDQVENQKSINEDLDTQLTVTKSKLNEIFHKCSSLEVELEYKNNCCEELEATCLEIQLQLESVATKETPKHVMNGEAKQSQNGLEIKAASVKLAECQETILNLGKQLKVLASPQDAVLFDRVFSNSGTAAAVMNSRRISKRFSLRDRMLADDGAKAEAFKSPSVKGTLTIDEAEHSSFPNSNSDKNPQHSGALLRSSESHLGSRNEVMALAIVPSKKQGLGLLRRLLLRRRRGYNKKSGYQKTDK